MSSVHMDSLELMTSACAWMYERPQNVGNTVLAGGPPANGSSIRRRRTSHHPCLLRDVAGVTSTLSRKLSYTNATLPSNSEI